MSDKDTQKLEVVDIDEPEKTMLWMFLLVSFTLTVMVSMVPSRKMPAASAVLMDRLLLRMS